MKNASIYCRYHEEKGWRNRLFGWNTTAGIGDQTAIFSVYRRTFNTGVLACRRAVETRKGEMVSVPLRGKDSKVTGVLNCFTKSHHEFSETDIYMLTAVANQAAVAIYNTNLIVKTRIVEQELKSRKVIERAEEILMDKRDMGGEDAYRWMQKRSMDARKSMLEIAEAILLSNEL